MANRRAALWVAAQLALLASYALIPRWSPLPVENLPPVTTVAMKTVAVAAMAGALFYAGRGLVDLGSNLTPLPTPRSDNHLVRHGVYALVRHPLYTALLHVALAWASLRVSALHLAVLPVLFLFFDRKAAHEEALLIQKHPEYIDYRNEVKKFVPWIY